MLPVLFSSFLHGDVFTTKYKNNSLKSSIIDISITAKIILFFVANVNFLYYMLNGF